MPKSPDTYPYLPGIEPVEPQPEKGPVLGANRSTKPAGEGQPQTDRKLEVTHCQYCEDAGPCMYCSRGKAEARNLKTRG